MHGGTDSVILAEVRRLHPPSPPFEKGEGVRRNSVILRVAGRRHHPPKNPPFLQGGERRAEE